jgi:DNA helicase-2/ATP-dependent DNA helicase PcrA
MRKYTIPYKLFGAISFYQRAEIKNIVSYLRILINKSDEQALKRIINFPKRGIGDTTVDKIIQFSNEKNITLWEVLCKIELLTRDLSSRIVTLIQKFVKLINYLSEEAQNLDAVSLVNLVLEKTGITLTMLEDRSPEGVAKYENLQEFVNAVHEYTNNNQENKVISIENFLEEIALATDQDSKETDTNKVSLMTIHASKGLEFKCVFIVGVEEGLFPSYRSITSNKDIEEERRLFYVAITRSERYLFISFCQKRMKWGVLQNASASRFIPEIESIYIEFEKLLENSSNNFDIKKENSNFVNSKIKIDIPKEKFSEKPINLKPIDNKEVSLQNSIEYSESNSYEIGMIVEHEKFGSGIIKDISGDFPNTKVLVNFEKNGQKNLLTKFAKLKIIK